MTRNDKFDDDDYVAKLLAEDAKKTSQRYAAVGLSALLPKRSSKTAPKPNTRFLNHLVREADSHNAALKKKEELEARIRLRELKSGGKHRRDDDEDRGHERKRRRVDGDRDSERRHRHHRANDTRRSTSPNDKNSRDRTREKSSRSHHNDRHDRERTRRRRSYSPEVITRDSNRLSPPSESDSEPERSSRRHKHSRGYRHRRSPRVSPAPEAGRHSRQHTTRSSSQLHTDHRSEDEFSDVLSSIIKPKTSNPTPRGRGTSSKSMMDIHFSKTYDPAQDVNVSSDENDDWDMALEALRDRTAWKRKQTERLREAGFGDDEIQRWERSAKDKDGVDRDVKDVRWKGKGEGKEWDEGKIGVT